MNTQLSDWRAAIDVVDGQLLTLLNLRAKLAGELVKVKRDQGLGIVDPEREREVLHRICRGNKGPLNEAALTRIWVRIMREARKVQAGELTNQLSR
jgi:chorismate mutase